MLRNFPAIIAATVIWLGFALPAAGDAAAETAAARHIQTLSSQAIALLQRSDLNLSQREAGLRDLFYQGFDIELIGRIVLGKAWRKATPQQRGDYLQLFGAYVVKTFANRLSSYAGETITVVGTRPTGKKDIFVDTRIDRPGGEPVKAAWRVRQTDGRSKVIDVMVEGISMTLTQRDEFKAIVRDNGVEGLIEVLRAKTERLSATPS